ncbi:lactoylglutathione lyase-like protein [Mycena vulgaris]|nr:lactoylglutathione lyase-like protein [Mycena vulgaris]
MTTDPSRYKFNHSMLRVKDPKASLKFYEFLGMKLIQKLENADAQHWTDREGIIELTRNYGTESDPEYKIMNGNTEPSKGFVHVCVSVDNIQAACARLEDAGYRFQKKLTDGRMRHIAFALDPDGYWVEIISFNSVDATADIRETSIDSYNNHTMIRVKDHEKSLAFYQDVMGMKLKRVSGAKFNLYFLGYGADAPATSADGTESDAEFKYHNGNDEPQGFGNICVTVDDLDAACARFEEKGVSWKKRLTDGRMKNIAFVLAMLVVTDPDNYWIEVVQNEALKNRANW